MCCCEILVTYSSAVWTHISFDSLIQASIILVIALQHSSSFDPTRPSPTIRVLASVFPPDIATLKSMAVHPRKSLPSLILFSSSSCCCCCCCSCCSCCCSYLCTACCCITAISPDLQVVHDLAALKQSAAVSLDKEVPCRVGRHAATMTWHNLSSHLDPLAALSVDIYINISPPKKRSDISYTYD